MRPLVDPQTRRDDPRPGVSVELRLSGISAPPELAPVLTAYASAGGAYVQASLPFVPSGDDVAILVYEDLVAVFERVERGEMGRKKPDFFRQAT